MRVLFTTVVVLWASNTVGAEEIGTTPDGNVIYRFECPSRITPKDVDIKIDWPNHVGQHPEWDIESGYGTTHSGSQSDVAAEYHQKSRDGQVLKCNYQVKFFNRQRGTFYYRYKVNRDIISCENLSRGWKCILKAEGGGK
jgi:hypothetical protein